MARDSQRSKVYASEQAYVDQWGAGRSLPTVGNIQEYVDDIIRSHWFLDTYLDDFDRIEVRDGRGRRRAGGHGRQLPNGLWVGVIKMPRWSRYELYVLHELSHVLTDYDEAVVGEALPPHGRHFCHNFVTLVQRFMTKAASRRLASIFRQHKVDYKFTQRKPTAYNQFIAQCMASKNIESKEDAQQAMKACAAEWKQHKSQSNVPLSEGGS